MDNSVLTNRLLVLKREGESLLLPMETYLEVTTPNDIPPGEYFGFRVERFEDETGELWLKYERGRFDVKAFAISIDENSEALLAHDIKKVRIILQKPTSYLTSKSFNSDINLDQRLNATKNLSEESRKEEPIIREVLLSVNSIQFEDGKASFEVFVNPILKQTRFEVENPFLKKEYDAIKNYFARALQTKKFSIQIEIESIGKEIVRQSATSNHIAQIDESLIERVEDYLIEDKLLSDDDEIINAEDILEDAAKFLGKEEINNPEWLLNKLITPEKTKHYYHLRFLSSKHVAGLCPLRLTGKPLSFIFLLQKDKSNFLIWETYKTEEATYLWRLVGYDEVQLNSEIEKAMKRITNLRKGNKLGYINSRPENFKRIEHDYSGADNGFKKWREALDEFMMNEG